jgi:hypothetical protein
MGINRASVREAERRRVKVAIGKFARSCLEAGFGAEVGAGAGAALRHYALRLEDPRAQPAELPPFPTEEDGDGATEIDISVPKEVEAALAGVAEERQAPLRLVVEHAIFVYCADLDAAASGPPSPDPSQEAANDPRYGDYARPGEEFDPPRPRRQVHSGGPLARDLGDRPRSSGGLGRR